MSEWNKRNSDRYGGAYIEWKYLIDRCKKHGKVEHVEIKEYSSKREKGDAPLKVCRACCTDIERRRAEQKRIDYLNKKRGLWG